MDKEFSFSYMSPDKLDKDDDRPFGIFIERTDDPHGDIWFNDAYVFITKEQATELYEFLKKHLKK